MTRIDPDGGSDCPNPPCDDVDGGTLDEVVVVGFFDKIKKDVFDTFVGWGNVLERTWNWFKGTEPVYRKEVNNNFSDAFKDAKGVESARQYFYAQLNRGRNLFDDPITNFDTKFGLDGLKNAGIDPYEQFVGTYKVTEISLIKTGKNTYAVQYTLHNKTHFKSLAYQIPGVPSWERGTVGFPNAMSTIRQDIIFTEPLQNNRLNKGVLRYINHNLNGITR